MNKFVFLDRDGVINKKIINGYVTNFTDFLFIDGVKQALKNFNSAEYKVIIITNQQCIGKKLLNIENLESIHKKMSEEIVIAGGEILDIFVCPHLASDNCFCRKPKPGMLQKAAEKYNISLEKTFFIGDSTTDMEAGKSAGTKTIFINSKEINDEKKIKSQVDFSFRNLLEASTFIIENDLISSS